MNQPSAIGVFLSRLLFFILIIAANYFVLAWLRPTALRWLLPAATLFGGLYFGFVEKSVYYSRSFIEFKKALGVVLVMTGVLIPLFSSKQGIVWEPYTEEKFIQAKTSGQPMIMDFFAEWCAPCHELDHFTYTDPEVIRSLENYIRFKVDLTDSADPAVQAAIERFEIPGVPVVSFLAPGGEELRQARITGFVKGKTLLQYIYCAEAEWAGRDLFAHCLKNT